MTGIGTLGNPEKTATVEVELKAEFPISESFEPHQLETWLERLPQVEDDGLARRPRVKFTGISSGKIMLVAYWKERR